MSAHASTPASGSEEVAHCRVVRLQDDQTLYAARPAALATEAAREVRLIYFLPNDRPYRPEVVDSMKAAVILSQGFYSQEMRRHGYGDLTFRFETDDQGQPLVHRVDGEHADRHYVEHGGSTREVWKALGRSPIEVVVIDFSSHSLPTLSGRVGGLAFTQDRNGQTFGTLVVPGTFSWRTVAHELGHTFGLGHDFRDSEYIMSYGGAIRDRLSACAAEFLAVHPYLNPDIGLSLEDSPSTIDLASPVRYQAGSQSVPVRLRISESSGLHQVLLFATTDHFSAGGDELKECRSFSGEPAAVVEFDYDGGIPSMGSSSLANPIVHSLHIQAVDTSGRTTRHFFPLYQTSERHVATFEEPASVTSLAFSPDGASLASAGGDPHITLRDLETRAPKASLGPAPAVWAVAISPDGATLASEHNGTARLWDLATGDSTATLEGRRGDSRFKAIAFSPDGRTLAVMSGDNTVQLWDLATETRSAELEHDTWIASMDFSPDGSRLAVAGGDGRVTLWDPASGNHVTALEAHSHWVGAVAFSPDGATLVSQSGWDGLVRIWDVETGRSVAAIENVRGGAAMAFSPDGATLACASGQLVNLWDVGTRVRIDSLAHGDLVQVVAFSPDGETLASGAWQRIELWDGSEWLKPRPHELVEISGDGQEGAPGAALESPLVVEVRDQYGKVIAGAPVTFVVTEGDGRLDGRFTVESKETDADGRAVALLSLGADPGPVTVEARLLAADPVTFDLAAVETPDFPLGDGDPRKWHLPDRAAVRLGRGSMEAALGRSGLPLSFSPDGRRLAVATSIGTWIHDPATAVALRLLPGAWVTSAAFSPDGTLAAGSRDGTVVSWDPAGGESAILYRHDGVVHSVAYSPDGTLLASGSRSRIRLWDVAGGTELWSVASDEPGALAFSPDGALLAVTGGSRITLWDVASAAKVTTLDAAVFDETEIRRIALSPDGATLASGSLRAIKLWDVAGGQELATLTGHTEPITSLAFSSDGTTLASGSWDHTIRLWDLATEANVETFGTAAPVQSLVFSPDGATLASMSWDDILLWDVETGSAARMPRHGLSVHSVALSPGGGAVAIGSAGSARLWDVGTGRDAATPEVRGDVLALAFSPDGSILGVGANRITLWDVARSQDIATLEGPSSVQSLAFSPDGAALAAGYWNGDIQLWDVADRRNILTLQGHTELVPSMAFSPDGAILASGSWDNTARLWDLERGQEIHTLEGYLWTGAVAFSPDGTAVAVTFPGGVRLLDPKTWNEVGFLSGSNINSLAFPADGGTLGAGFQDGTVRLYDTETWRRAATLEGHVADVNSLAFSRDGATLVTGSRDGTVLLWDLTPRPHALRIVSGDGQKGEPGTLLPGTLIVEVRDENGDLLEGARVAFTVTGGGGTLSTATATTDSRGQAAATLTLGGSPGPNTVEVTVEGLETTLFTATARAMPDFDGDGEVGFADFFLFAEAFGGSDPRFDLDGSGSVDFADFFLFAESFGQPARARLMALARDRIGLPDGPQLQQNWPNPFNSGTVISWFLLQPGPARLEVFALNGQRVAVLTSGDHKAGLHRLRWDGRDDRGRPLASGTYLYRLVTTEQVSARKFVLIR